MIRRPPRSTQGVSSAASDVYKRQPKSIVGVREAAAMLLAGLGVYVAVYQTALAVDKPSTQPFADKTFPFDGLKKELGR